jgi:transcriptional regulator NrdR family protein
MTSVIGKTTESYNRERLSKSVKCAITANRTPVGDAENFVSRVIEQIERWLVDKTEVTGRELRFQTAAALADYDADAADYYLTEKMLF